VAPGVSCWRNVYPDLNTAKINIFNFVRDGYKHKASGVLNTTWDDDGFNLFQNNWHGLAWGAEVSWKAPDPKLSEEVFPKRKRGPVPTI
jgi:hexosaminidase